MPWPLPSGKAARLALAKGYPYEAPASSYRFRDGAIDHSPPADWPRSAFLNRFPVIAHGSNRAPEQLARKYVDGEAARIKGAAAAPNLELIQTGAETLHREDIPVTRTRLYDYEVVYSAHMTRYGAVAANLQYALGAAVDVFITWLNAAQLQRMHDTELGGEIYRFGLLRGVTMEHPTGPLPPLESVFVYLSFAGCLRVEEKPAGIAAIPAAKRGFPVLSQLEALETVRSRLRPELDLDDFILMVIAEPTVRSSVIEALRADAVALDAPHFELLDPAETVTSAPLSG